MVFCHEDGCNQLAKNYTLSAFEFIWDLPQYVVMGLILLAVPTLIFCVLGLLCQLLCMPIIPMVKKIRGQPLEMYEPIA